MFPLTFGSKANLTAVQDLLKRAATTLQSQKRLHAQMRFATSVQNRVNILHYQINQVQWKPLNVITDNVIIWFN